MTSKAIRSRGMPRRRAVEPPASAPRRLMVVGAAILAVVVLAAVAAVLLSSTPSGLVAEPAARPVAITGEALPAFTGSTGDTAIGQPIPRLTGIGLDGAPVSIGPDDGPVAVVVLAHWCSFCQAEVPPLVDYLDAGSLPSGVRVVALTTAIDPARPNFPPSTWLEREAWTVPTLIDDASDTGLRSLGLASFPAFVFVDADGLVAHRHTGALGADAFGQLVELIAR